MWSSESAPIRILVASPERSFRLDNTLKKNSFLVPVPAQSVQRSCSIENESKERDMSGADEGAAIGMETFTPPTVDWRDSQRRHASKVAFLIIVSGGKRDSREGVEKVHLVASTLYRTASEEAS